MCERSYLECIGVPVGFRSLARSESEHSRENRIEDERYAVFPMFERQSLDAVTTKVIG